MYARAGLRKVGIQELEYIRRSLDEYIANMAVREGLATSVDSIVVRDILPARDFGTTYYPYNIWRKDFTSGTVNDWNLAAKVDLDGDKVVGIYGVAKSKDGDDIVSAIKFTRGFGDTDIVDIWVIDDLEPGEAKATDSPIVYSSTDTMGIYHYLKNLGVDAVVILGRVAEAAGREITAGRIIR